MSSLIDKILFEAKILESKQVGVLYHYTSLENIYKILLTNRLESGDAGMQSDSYDGLFISTTRDKNFHNQKRTIDSTECRIVLNGDKISNRYKIIPHNQIDYDKTRSNNTESEEAILSDVISNLNNYIIRIDFFKHPNKNIINFLNKNKINYKAMNDFINKI